MLKSLIYTKKIYDNLLSFIDCEEGSENEELFSNLINSFENIQIIEEIKPLLYTIKELSQNHHRFPVFFTKIERILAFFEEDIKKSFTSSELLTFFKEDKRILLFLYKNKLINYDRLILLQHIDYFYPENRIFSPNFKIEYFEDKIEQEGISYLQYFEEKRLIGENPSYICELIRNDSVKEFIIFVNINNISINKMEISSSFFETNSFLLNYASVSLIEYSAFYGSIQIFQYLILNNAELTSSLWLFSIHGKNAEIIHLLEENHIKPKDETFKECYIESIKCHHNEIAKYIENNLLDQDFVMKNIDIINDDDNILLNYFRYYNFDLLPNNCSPQIILAFLIKFNYFETVKKFIAKGKIDLNKKIIHQNQFFLLIKFQIT